MPVLTKGEKWIKLLRAYGPVADNEAMQAEHVGKLSAYLGIPKIAFEHPARKLILECFPKSSGLFRNLILTGTAGEGKTSLCFELVQELAGRPAVGHNGVEVISVDTPFGPQRITLIYDVTAWREKNGGFLIPTHVDIIWRMAVSAYGESNEFFVLAINDGQVHELFRAIPKDAPEIIRRLEKDVIGLHANGRQDSGNRLRLINLSLIPSEQIMSLCLAAVLDRPEWICLKEETDIAIFAQTSSVTRNFRALSSSEIRAKLIMLARVADVTGHHLPTRGILCLLANALLGHPDARDKVMRAGTEANNIAKSGRASKAALHRTLFGENLTANNRKKREIYRFLSLLHVGDETTNNLDELILFGTKDDELHAAHAALIAFDPFEQHDLEFDAMLVRYIRGDIDEEEKTDLFLAELSAERRRVFLHASQQQIQEHSLWQTTVFHYADDYLSGILKAFSEGRVPARTQIRKIAAGLNRIWTGLLVADSANEVYFATGLDLTTSSISDIFLEHAEMDSEPPGLEIVRAAGKVVPDVILRTKNGEFRFPLTLTRFEFIRRVAEGAMPSSFSHEACADFMSLKQRCLRDLKMKSGTRSLYLIEIHGAGIVEKSHIHLAE